MLQFRLQSSEHLLPRLVLPGNQWLKKGGLLRYFHIDYMTRVLGISPQKDTTSVRLCREHTIRHVCVCACRVCICVCGARARAGGHACACGCARVLASLIGRRKNVNFLDGSGGERRRLAKGLFTCHQPFLGCKFFAYN